MVWNIFKLGCSDIDSKDEIYLQIKLFKSPQQTSLLGLTVAGLLVVCWARGDLTVPLRAPGLHPPAAALTPPAVPHRVLPQLTQSSQLGKLPGRTFTVASAGIKSSFGGLSPGLLLLIISFSEPEHYVGSTLPLTLTNIAPLQIWGQTTYCPQFVAYFDFNWNIPCADQSPDRW